MMWFRFLIWTPLTLWFFPFAVFLLFRRFCRVLIMDRNVLQAQLVAIRCECRIPGVGISFRIHENTIPAVFTLDQHAMPAKAVQRFGVCRERGVLLFFQYFHLSFPEQNQPVRFSGGLGRSPRCVWISKRYACKTSHRLGKKKRR